MARAEASESQTLCLLDVPRPTMSEPSIHRTFPTHTSARSPQNGKNVLYWWATGAMTLMPCQMTPAFYESGLCEPLKLRATDMDFQPDWWSEYHLGVNEDYDSDFFMATKVTADNFTNGLTGLLGAMTDIAVQTINIDAAFNSFKTKTILVSKKSYPENQPYCLRVRLNGHPALKLSNAFTFTFGNVGIQFHTTGKADLLLRNPAGGKFAYAASFDWGEGETLEDCWHTIIIYPHHLNAIEIVSGRTIDDTGHRAYPNYSYTDPFRDTRDSKGKVQSFVYKIPGAVQFGANGDPRVPKITAKGKWSVGVNALYHVDVQVSLLGFWNGSGSHAFVFADPFGIEYKPAKPVTLALDTVQPAKTLVKSALYDHVESYLNAISGGSLVRFTPNGKMHTPQAYIEIQGKNDIQTKKSSVKSQDSMSSISPEVYSYTLSKDADFLEDTRQPTAMKVRAAIRIDQGDGPDSERLKIIINNGRGEMEAFRRRAKIPMQLIDAVSNRILFEGDAIDPVWYDDDSGDPRVELNCEGLAWHLTNSYCIQLDFSTDPNDFQTRQAWFWGDAFIKCMEVGGFDSTQVVIEDRAKYDFRFWTAGPAGGTRDDANSQAASTNSSEGRWRPSPKTPIYQFMEMFIRDLLGWHFGRDREDQKWHAWKRPTANDVQTATPRVAFWKSPAALAQGKLDYPEIEVHLLHREIKERVVAPVCTTIVAYTVLNPVPADGFFGLAAAIQTVLGAMASAPTAFDNSPISGGQLYTQIWDNRRGYRSKTGPTPNPVDDLGSRTERTVNLSHIATRDGLEWVGRRLYEDNCLGHVDREFIASWGDHDETTYFRKYDVVLVDGERATIDRCDPNWNGDFDRTANYKIVVARPDAPPPR